MGNIQSGVVKVLATFELELTNIENDDDIEEALTDFSDRLVSWKIVEQKEEMED